MKERSDFKQFTATPVTYSTAMKLARQATGRNGITVMFEMRKQKYGELLLPSGAKLKYDPHSEEFSIFSYSSDGNDGWEAYCSANTSN